MCVCVCACVCVCVCVCVRVCVCSVTPFFAHCYFSPLFLCPPPPLHQAFTYSVGFPDFSGEDILCQHLDLNLDCVRGGVRDLGVQVRHLANEHGLQKVDTLNASEAGDAVWDALALVRLGIVHVPRRCVKVLCGCCPARLVNEVQDRSAVHVSRWVGVICLKKKTHLGEGVELQCACE